MTPEQFLLRIAKQPPAPAYLFLGQEAYQRRICKQALLARVLTGGRGSEGLTQVDLENISLSEVLDDARSLSLFSSERLIWVCSAELAMPRRLNVVSDDGEERETSAASQLTVYLNAPTPGTVIVFECSRYDFSGEDRAKLERVQKFYSAIPAVVEFQQFTVQSSRHLAQELARERDLKLGGRELAVLLETVSNDASRLTAEIEKLALFVGQERAVTMDDLQTLVPNAAQSTTFALVNALGRGDRAAALQSLDLLVREGEYLPLALTFLGTQFRLALAAKEAHVSSVPQALSLFSKIGVRMWRDRAEQVMLTAAAFTGERLASGIALIYDTDKKFREGYRDDRLIMESLVLALTAGRPSNV